MPKTKWKIIKFGLNGNKIKIIAKDMFSGKTKNLTGPGINIEGILNEFNIEEIKKRFSNLISKWDGKRHIKELTEKDFSISVKRLDLNKMAEINNGVFDIFNNTFVSYSKKHHNLMKLYLMIFSDFLKLEEFNILKNNIYFGGGTSLYFYYKKFYRFSKDLDFTAGKNFSLLNKKLIINFFNEIGEVFIEKSKLMFNIEISEEEFGDKKIYNFLDEEDLERNINIDFVPSNTIHSKKLKLGNELLEMVSLEDTICNKLLRQSKIDILDITYLIRKEKISLETIKVKYPGDLLNKYIEVIQQKGNQKYLPFLKSI